MSNIITAGNATNNGTSISSDTSGVLELKTGSTPTTAIAVDASQNVGIGTSSPTGKLDVVGDSVLRGSLGMTTAGYVYSYAGGTNGQVRSGVQFDGTNQQTLFFTGTNERMRITSAGVIYAGGTSSATSTNPIYSTTTARAWCYYNGVTQTIANSFNISSVTYNAAGDYTFNMTNAGPTLGALFASKSNQITNAANAQGISWNNTGSFGLVNYEGGSKTNSPVYVTAFS
jgi:hypothetical protein